MKSTDDITSFIKEEYLPLIVCLSLLICTVLTGGLNWYSCIISLFLITVCILLKFKKIKLSSVIYAIVMLTIAMISLANTNGDFQVGLYETEKIVLFIATILVGTTISKRENILNSLYVMALASAVFGILIYCGFFEAGEFVLEDFGKIRLQSFFKYANTTACFLGMGYYACLEIYSFTKNQIHLFFGMVILLAMYLTLSKAVIPLFLIIGMYSMYRRKEIAVPFVNNNIITMLFVLPVNLLVQRHIFFSAFWLVIACIIIGANIKIIKTESNAIKMWKWSLVVAIIGGIILLIIKPSLFTTFSQRITYMKDSLGTLFDSLILGNGPGSWRLMKYSFQSGGYNVMYMHNSFLQLLFENGLIFTVLFVALLLKTIIICILKRYDCFAVILILLTVHSFVDFNLSFGVMLLVLGLILGNIGFENCKIDKLKFLKIPLTLMVICTIFLTGVYMLTEYSLRSSFEKDCISHNYEAALDKAYKLERLCPRDSMLQMNIAALIEKTSGNLNEIKIRTENAHKLSPYDTLPYEAYVNYNMTKGNIRDLCLKYISMRPRYEGTHQVVKVFINRAYSRNIIDEEYKNSLLEEMGNLRYSLKIYDRDELLDRIMNQRKNKGKEAD